MTEIPGRRLLRGLVFFSFISLQFVSGLSDDPPKSVANHDASSASGGSTGYKILIACFVIVVVVLLSFFLVKLWQKKKRDEQYARFLKLFEEDDELELELGLRD